MLDRADFSQGQLTNGDIFRQIVGTGKYETQNNTTLTLELGPVPQDLNRLVVAIATILLKKFMSPTIGLITCLTLDKFHLLFLVL